MNTMKRTIVTTLCLLLLVGVTHAQRTTDILDRGLVAVPSGSGSFVSWRIFAEEYYDTEYNLYRDGVKVNAEPLKVSNYVDAGGKAGATYQVAAVVRGEEQPLCEPVARWNQQYKQFAVGKLYSRRGTDITNSYEINDIALADVTGDGRSEFILKRNYSPDGSSVANDSAYNCLDCYTLEGERLWYIDLGPNMVSGPDEQYDAVGYDWDGDGRAEVLMRGADNMIIHHADGTTTNIGNMSVNTRNTVTQTANMTYTNSGAEYLLYLEGATGKPYAIGPNGQLWMSYPLPRGAASDWGDGYGHRSTKHYFAAPFLDGRHPYIFLGRGCYTKHHMKAFSVDPGTHQLSLYWEWSSGSSGVYYGQGYHNFGIADVDWDGRDEIVFGSMVIDDNGQGLSTTGLGHGDAQHCSDFDPYRHGQEIFACNESQPAMNYRDATTSKIYYRLESTSDDGRALCGNFSNAYPGAIGHSSQSGTISCVADKPISGAPSGFTNNWRLYWDGDLLEEGLDGASSREGAARVFKGDGSIVFTADGTANCNWTKNTPSAVGDILGDWREEIIARTSDNKYVRVYTTNLSTKWRNYTLWHDHQYRQGMVWESVGYNQPPHASYFLGELEGITVAPPPLTMTGRTETTSIGTGMSSEHVIVCDWSDTQVSVSDGADPWVATFYVPSWVQGTNSTATNGSPKINREYYTCTVTGGGFGGSTRLVKQGDGTLNLPNVEQRHTGNTDIWAGAVNFDGSMLLSSVWLNRFAALNSDGGKFRSISMSYASTLRPGREANVGTITTDSLLLGFGARVVFDVDSEGQTDKLNAALITIETKSWEYGPEYLTPVFEFTTADGSTPQLSSGKHLLGLVSTVEGSLDNIRLEGLDTKSKSHLSVEDGHLYLVVEGLRESDDIVWSGSESAVWDMDVTANFVGSNGEQGTFVTGDNVIFNDDAKQFNVTLVGDLIADSIIVDNTKTYTFSGSGSIAGNSMLVKRGKGTLNVRTDNTYLGGTRIEGGSVSVTSLSNPNQEKGNLGALQAAYGKFVMANGGELRTTAAVTNGSAITMEGDEGGVINNSNDFISARAINGTTLTKKGSGWMKLNVANPGLQRLIVQTGTLQCINCNQPAQTVEYQGGTLSENTGSSYTVYVAQGKKGTWNLANRSTYTNKVTGQGTLTINCVTEKGTNYYATRTPVQCNFSDFEGTIVPSSSLDDPALLRFTLNIAGGMPKGTMNIAEKVEVQNSGKTFHIGQVTGTGSLGGSCTFSNNTTVGANTWQVGNDNNWSTSVKVNSNANLTKVGAGRITWNGANSNTGNTVVNEGELLLTETAHLGTGRLTVNANGVLSGTTANGNPLTNSTVTVNGTLRPGSFSGATSGTLYFGQKGVTINEGATLSIGASRCATETRSGCSSIDDIAMLTINGTISVATPETHTLQVGDSIRIFKAESFAGTPKFVFQGNVEWDTSRISEGLLFVKAIGAEGIEAVKLSDVLQSGVAVFDLQGRKLSAAQLRQGLYIINGRKVVVKQ